jgi:hypothetical protein
LNAGAAGIENEIIFGLRADEVGRLRDVGYDPARFTRDPSCAAR